MVTNINLISPQSSQYHDIDIKYEQTETGRFTYLVRMTQLGGGWSSDLGCACKISHFFFPEDEWISFSEKERICHLSHVYEKEIFSDLNVIADIYQVLPLCQGIFKLFAEISHYCLQ